MTGAKLRHADPARVERPHRTMVIADGIVNRRRTRYRTRSPVRAELRASPRSKHLVCIRQTQMSIPPGDARKDRRYMFVCAIGIAAEGIHAVAASEFLKERGN